MDLEKPNKEKNKLKMCKEKINSNYVLGFAFNEEETHIALIRKNKPEWQKGKLNGIGGKIESEEIAYDAMIREFAEETGIFIYNWEKFGRIYENNENNNSFQVYLFKSFISNVILNKLESKTEEIVSILPIKDIPYSVCIPNLSWLIPLALHPYNIYMLI